MGNHILDAAHGNGPNTPLPVPKAEKQELGLRPNQTGLDDNNGTTYGPETVPNLRPSTSADGTKAEVS